MAESDTKAWVRFRYPRWMYAGAAICGVPVEASRGFLRGWYAQNGVSLGNPRLGFVCVSEDMTGQYGLCGYFMEYDRDLSEEERLVFAPDERPPPYDPAQQPAPPDAEWSAERLAKANRNYAVEYIRNGVRELVNVLGEVRALALARRAARLTGLQHYRAMADAVCAVDGAVPEAALFLAAMLEGMDDAARAESIDGASIWRVRQEGLRIVRGIAGAERAHLLSCWIELWRGAIASHRAFMTLDVAEEGDTLVWTISLAA
ncbi:MAG TPA: hypothetical protein PKL84_17250, partial [Candidatus Hydrogenedentes bacterium]|nr:hypothetical protein [Candidatus Hydrogenedentota bacterium]